MDGSQALIYSSYRCHFCDLVREGVRKSHALLIHFVKAVLGIHRDDKLADVDDRYSCIYLSPVVRIRDGLPVQIGPPKADLRSSIDRLDAI